MAFALALQSVHEHPEGHGKPILTATTAIVVLTVFAHFSHSLILGTSHEMMKLPIGMAFLCVLHFYGWHDALLIIFASWSTSILIKLLFCSDAHHKYSFIEQTILPK